MSHQWKENKCTKCNLVRFSKDSESYSVPISMLGDSWSLDFTKCPPVPKK